MLMTKTKKRTNSGAATVIFVCVLNKNLQNCYTYHNIFVVVVYKVTHVFDRITWARLFRNCLVLTRVINIRNTHDYYTISTRYTSYIRV